MLKCPWEKYSIPMTYRIKLWSTLSLHMDSRELDYAGGMVWEISGGILILWVHCESSFQSIVAEIIKADNSACQRLKNKTTNFLQKVEPKEGEQYSNNTFWIYLLKSLQMKMISKLILVQYINCHWQHFCCILCMVPENIYIQNIESNSMMVK